MAAQEFHAKMEWQGAEELNELAEVEKIRAKIVTGQGVLFPKENAESLGLMAHYYARMCERVGKYKAMRDRYFAELLTLDPDMKIGRAEALAYGSEFGAKGKYYENLAAGYLEIVNSLKKIQEYQETFARHDSRQN